MTGPTHTNMIFDVVVPSYDEISHEKLRQMIDKKVKALNESYFCVIQVEHSFV